MSRVKVNEITNKVATGPVDFPDGITGVALTVTGNVTVGGTIISEDTTNVDSVGWVTARSGLTVGPPATGIGATVHSNGNAVFAGITTVGGDFSIADKIIHTGDTDTAIRFSGADTITAETGGSERVRITGIGSVAIGGFEPDSLFHIGKGTNADDGTVTFTIGGSAVNTRQSTITKNNVGSGDRALEFRAATGTSHEKFKFLSDNTTERLLIGSSGELGLNPNGTVGVAATDYGTSGQVLTSGGSGASATWADVSAGMSEYDVWTIDYETSTGVFDNNIIGQTTAEGSPVTVNLSRVTTTQNARFAKVGTGMTVTSGIWTFPSTGYWEVIFSPNGYSTGAAQRTWKLKTTDNNSTYVDSYWTYGYGGVYTQDNDTQHSFLNITDVSNQKIQWVFVSGGVNYSFYGSSSKVMTNWVFKKVA